MATTENPSMYGVMAEFSDLSALISAAGQARSKGYRHLDAFTPFPSEELNEALGIHDNILPKLVFCGGLTGVIGGFSMQYIAAAVHYPWIVGGKPYNSWPAFIPISYEMMILFSALTAVIGMFLLNGLPMPYHPVFHVKSFEKASQDGFFLAIEAKDPRFNLEEAKGFLQSLNPLAVHEVPL